MPRCYSRTALLLLAAMLFVALLATGISHWLTSRALNRTIDELQTLRNETGQLTIRNADHLHVIALPITEGLAWSWRMHIPQGRKYRLRWVVGQAIPKEGFPEKVAAEDVEDVMFSETPPSPFVLSARVHFDNHTGDNHTGDNHTGDNHTGDNAAGGKQTGQWKLAWRHLLHQASIPLDFGDDIDWLVGQLRYGPTLAGHTETESFPPGERIVLLRVRRFQDAMAGAYSIAEDPCDGFMVWLEPI